MVAGAETSGQTKERFRSSQVQNRQRGLKVEGVSEQPQ